MFCMDNLFIYLFLEHDVVLYSYNMITAFNYLKHIYSRYILQYCKTALPMDKTVLLPPVCVKGMKELDRSKFNKTVNIPAILLPRTSLKDSKKILKKKMITLHIKKVINPPDEICVPEKHSAHKLLLLQPGTEFTDQEKNMLNDIGYTNEILQHKILIGYENYKHADILKAILPDDDDVTRGYSQTGHILHVNLREHQLPYKHIIGQVLLDKIPNVETVVHKPITIENEFRNFQMEVIAGKSNFITKVIEHGRRFEFDFSKVFWNSRLSAEHQRIASVISKDDVVFDMFAGVGPFAIPLAKKGCLVYANDLNPDSFRWLEHNARINKTTQHMHCFNLDGRDFIQKEMHNFLSEAAKSCKVHVLMNLPAIAVDFLDVFPGLMGETHRSRDGKSTLPEVIIHLYMFTKEPENTTAIRLLMETHLGGPLHSELSVHYVRNVAPKKEMLCVSFRLPADTTLLERNQRNVSSECDTGLLQSKRLKLDDKYESS